MPATIANRIDLREDGRRLHLDRGLLCWLLMQHRSRVAERNLRRNAAAPAVRRWSHLPDERRHVHGTNRLLPGTLMPDPRRLDIRYLRHTHRRWDDLLDLGRKLFVGARLLQVPDVEPP